MGSLPHVAMGLLFCMSSVGAALGQEILPHTDADFPKADVANNQVYGKILYSIQVAPGIKTAPNFKTFIQSSVKNLFGGEDGSYLITLSVKNKSEEIARKAIFSFTWKKKSIFSFENESDVTGLVSFSGRLADHFPVTAFNNNLSVSLQLLRTQNITLDTNTYNELSEQAGLLSFSALLPALEIAKSLQGPLNIIAKILNSYKKEDITSEIAMSFIKEGSSGNPKIATFSLHGPSDKKSDIKVRVTLETDSSLLQNFNVTTGKFVNLNLKEVYAMARIGMSKATISFEEALADKGHERIRGMLADLNKRKFPDDETPGSVCQSLFDATQEFYSQRDAPAVYASFLDRFEATLANQQGAKPACIDDFSITLDKYDIPYKTQIGIQ